MIRYIALISVVFGLLGLVIYSQLRPKVDFVSGVIEVEEIRLGSRVGGRVHSVLVDEGDKVQISDRLIEFEPYNLIELEQQAQAVLQEREASLKKFNAGMRKEEIAQAKARYDDALAQLSLIKDGPRKEEIAAAENRLTAASSDTNLASNEFQRQSSLFERNAVSKSEFDSAKEKLTATKSTEEVRRNELAILKAGARRQEIQMAEAKVEDLRLAWELAKKGFRTEEIEQATAARNAASAALESIRKQRQELVIDSPVNGTIDSLDLQAGDLVAPNAPVMTVLSDNMWVRAYVPQRFLKLQVGQKLRITVDTYPNQEFQGEVSFISQQAEFTPSNVQTFDDRAKQVYRIRITLPKEKGKLRPGMTANVWLDSAGSKND